MTTKVKPTAIYDASTVPWQIDAWRDRSRICVYGGSAGGGKSRAASEKLHGFMLRYPGAVGIALRKAREFASKSVPLTATVPRTSSGPKKRTRSLRTITTNYLDAYVARRRDGDRYFSPPTLTTRCTG